MVVTARRAAEPRVFCSRACKDAARNGALSAMTLAAKAAAPPRSCPHCAGTLDPAMRADARFCSHTCEQAAHNTTRKARWRTGRDAEYVSGAYIFDRDGGRCHICRARCPRDVFHLDHLIPIADGGQHAPENLAVSCPGCNLSRGRRGAAQLLLVG